MRLLAYALVASLMLPSVLAETDLVVSRLLLAPTSSFESVTSSVAFGEDAERVHTLRANASHASVTIFEWRRATLGVPGAPVSNTFAQAERSYSLTDLTIELAAGEHAGWLALDGGVSIQALAAGPVSMTSRSGGAIGHKAASTNPEDHRFYSRVMPGVHLLTAGDVQLSAEGNEILLWLSGPDVRLAARENSTVVRTGDLQGEAGAGDRLDRVARIVMSSSAVQVDGVQLVIATEEGTARGAPGTRLDEIVLPEWTRMSVSPIDHRAGIDLEEDALAEGSAFIERAVAPVDLSPLAWLVGILGLVAIAAVTTVALRARHGADAGPMADDYAALAALAIEQSRHEDALRWTREALRHAPASGRLKLEEAYLLAQLGRTDEALEAYDEAATPDADLHAAMLLTRLGQLEVAEAKLVAALDAAPSLLLEVEGPPLDVLTGRPAVRRAMAEARARMEDE